MTPKPDRKRPGATSPVRGRLKPEPEPLRVGDQGGEEQPKGGLWGRLEQMASGEAPAAAEPQTPEPPEIQTSRVPESQTPAVRGSGAPVVPESRTPAPEPAQGQRRHVPRYLTLSRVEARLREDQIDGLAALRRRVAANRTDRSERITDNTLIRIAVDWVLQYGDQVRGNTEEEMRRNLRLRGPQ